MLRDSERGIMATPGPESSTICICSCARKEVHLHVDGIGLQGSYGLVKERQVSQAPVVAACCVICGAPAQHDGPRQIHRRPAIDVQQVAVLVCNSTANVLVMEQDPMQTLCSSLLCAGMVCLVLMILSGYGNLRTCRLQKKAAPLCGSGLSLSSGKASH